MARPSGHLIRELRRRKGLTTHQLAQRAGFAERTLRNLEHEDTETPHPETLAALAGALGVEPEELFDTPRTRYRFAGWTAGATALLVMVALIAWWLSRPAELSIRSIAVLPLRNLSGDPEQEYFTDGITDSVISALAKIEALPVISFTSIIRYKNTEKPLPEIAQELGVDGIIEGTVMRAGGRVRIAVQLVDGRSDVNLWNESYERELSDVLALQNEVARAVASQVEAVLSPEEQLVLADDRHVDPGAYDAYLRGMHLLTGASPAPSKSMRGDNDRAIEYFERAIELGPEFAPAYVGLARAVRLGALSLSRERQEELLPGIVANIERALELDSQLPLAYAELAVISWRHKWNWEEAERNFRRALEIGPSEADVLSYYSWFLAANARHDEAFDVGRRAVGLAPLDLLVRRQVAFNLSATGRLDETLEACEELLEVEPLDPALHFLVGRIRREQGRDRDAVQALATSFRLFGQAWAALELERGYESSGYTGAVRAFLDALIERRDTVYVSPATIADFFADIGEVDLAFEWLEVGYQERDWGMARLKTSRWLSGLRSDPRYDDLLRRIGFPES